MPDYNKDLERAEVAEEIVYSILKRYVTLNKRTGIAALFDVRKLPHAQAGDYDFSYRTWENMQEVIRLDVKSDSRIGKTNNFFIEDSAQMNRTKELKKGWMHYSIANFIYYLDEQRELIYIFSMNDMRDYISKNKCKKGKCYDYNKIVEGYIVNLFDYSYKYNLEIMDLKGNYLNEERLQHYFN